jgi:colanic acid biosynthesis glycosyl transferase WcaI
MRILFLSTYFRPDTASTGVLMTQLAEELVKMGHQITVVTSMPHYNTNSIWPAYRRRLMARESWGDMKVRRVYLYVPRKKEKVLGRLFNYVTFNTISALAAAMSGRPDVIFVPSPPLTNGVEGFFLSRLFRVPFIYNVQDIYPDVAVRLGVLRNPRIIRTFQRMEQFVYRKAAAVSVISEGFRRNLLCKGVPESKLHVIPNFVDTGFVSPRPRRNEFSVREELNDRYVVLFAGNVGLSQDLETILEAAKILACRPDILFLVVGNGAAKEGLMEQVERMSLANVRFLPFQPHEVVPDLYGSADVCLVPLRQGLTEESVPCKVFTILGAARPLVASVDHDSDTSRFVKEAGCGLCVEPGDPLALSEAILDLHRDREMAAEMGRRGHDFVATNFTSQRIAHQYHDLFQRVTGRR